MSVGDGHLLSLVTKQRPSPISCLVLSTHSNILNTYEYWPKVIRKVKYDKMAFSFHQRLASNVHPKSMQNPKLKLFLLLFFLRDLPQEFSNFRPNKISKEYILQPRFHPTLHLNLKVKCVICWYILLLDWYTF